jgi:hypothetical protein
VIMVRFYFSSLPEWSTVGVRGPAQREQVMAVSSKSSWPHSQQWVSTSERSSAISSLVKRAFFVDIVGGILGRQLPEMDRKIYTTRRCANKERRTRLAWIFEFVNVNSFFNERITHLKKESKAFRLRRFRVVDSVGSPPMIKEFRSKFVQSFQPAIIQ